jgi:hypothetical protein
MVFYFFIYFCRKFCCARANLQLVDCAIRQPKDKYKKIVLYITESSENTLISQIYIRNSIYLGYDVF